MAKIHGVYLGVRERSGERIAADEESKDTKYTRTAKRIPEETRWSADNFEWVARVPWNRGRADEEADGEVSDFGVKHRPGRPLTEMEKQNIMTNEAQRAVRQAYLLKQDFEKRGFTDRCPGCSAILRGTYLQPIRAYAEGEWSSYLKEKREYKMRRLGCESGQSACRRRRRTSAANWRS